MEVIVTLLIALGFFILGPFNADPIQLNLFGLQSLPVQLNLLTFVFFMTGAAYMAFWTVLNRFRTQAEIRGLHREIEALKREPARQETTKRETTAVKTDDKEPEPVAEERDSAEEDSTEEKSATEKPKTERKKEDLVSAAVSDEPEDYYAEDDAPTACEFWSRFRLFANPQNWFKRSER